MTIANYNRQHLAVVAAGHINADGSTVQSFGCSLTRLDAGHYGLLLNDDSGIVDDETFLRVSVKGSAARTYSVIDVSNVRKDIFTFDSGLSPTSTAIEVALFRSVTRK